MPGKAPVLQLSRKTHLYLGVFIAPALLFFAFTGALQTLGLHEASANYKPAALLATLGQIHKKQTLVLPVHRPAPAEAAHPDAGRPATGHADAGRPPSAAGAPQQAPTLQTKQKQHLPLKIFFLVVSIGLFLNTLTGVYMAYVYDRNKWLITGLLLVGIVLPLALLPF